MRLVKVLAVYSVKGGVGKTAAAVNLSWLAAREGHRTLLWDLDPQAAATFLLRVKTKVRGGSRKLLLGRTEAESAIKQTVDERLDLLPAETTYASADHDLHEAKNAEDRVRKVLRPLREHYDVVVLDCPPGLSLVSTNVVRAADLVLVPIVPSPLSLRTLDQVTDLMAANPDRPAQLLAYLSMVERRRALHRDVIELLRGKYADISPTTIPASATVERMGQRRRPVVAFAGSSAPAQAYEELWREVAQRLGSDRRRVEPVDGD